MKALEILGILKEYIEDENRLGDLNYAHYSNIIDYVDEAIKELEDLQNRSCENCKYFSTGNQPDGFSWYECEHDFECKTNFPDKFERYYGYYFEKKETK